MRGAVQGNRRAHRLFLRLGLVALLCMLTLDAAVAQAAHRPDLVVKQVTVPAGPFAPGDEFSATNKVTNAGQRRSPKSTTYYVLSANTSRDQSDASAGTAEVPKLKPRKSTTSSPNLVIPPDGLADGSYYLIACADGPGEIHEKREGNNCASSDSQIAVSSAPPAPRVLGATATSATSVLITFDHQINAATLQSNGSQFTIPGLTVTAASANNNQVTLTTTSQSPGTSYTVTVAGSVQDTDGTGVDPAHNSASFSGFTPAAHLLLNEVAPNITGNADLVELRATTGGSVAGMTLQQDVASPTVLATLPAVTVATGELIVVHLAPPVDVTSETGSKTDCVSLGCFPGAWDVAGGANGIPFSDRVLTVNAANANLNDAAPFVRPASMDRAGFPPDVQALQVAGEWLPADCGGALCDYTTTPTVLAISVDWSAASSSTGSTTATRSSGTDTNSNADWTVSASTMGAPN